MQLQFQARGGVVTLTEDDVRQHVLPYLRHAKARAAVASILEREDEARIWDLEIPDAPDAQEELVAQIVRAGGPALTESGRAVRMFAVELRPDEQHSEREMLRYWSEVTPEVGEAILVEGVPALVQNVLSSRDSVMLECSRVSEPAE